MWHVYFKDGRENSSLPQNPWKFPPFCRKIRRILKKKTYKIQFFTPVSTIMQSEFYLVFFWSILLWILETKKSQKSHGYKRVKWIVAFWRIFVDDFFYWYFFNFYGHTLNSITFLQKNRYQGIVIKKTNIFLPL